MARDEGWLAEHMLILKLTSPQGVTKYVAAAFPSACGKTNLAMLKPTIPGWKVEAIGDDIAWMRIGEDGRLWAVNPEFGFFGVAPGTNEHTNPHAMETIRKGNSVFTNVALTPDGNVWWEGLENTPAEATSWKGEPWTPEIAETGELSSHANSRYCTPIKQCSILADEYDDPRGVPIDAILFGGRRKTTIPLVTEARDWNHGTFMGATLSSETTAAAVGAVGVVRRDPMAMLPFIGYNAGDYFSHWVGIGKDNDAAKLPKMFYVNWFRRGDDGDFLWPGFGENSRVLKWVIERIDGQAAAVETPIGHVPAPGSLDVDGLDLTDEQLAQALAVDAEEWRPSCRRSRSGSRSSATTSRPCCGPSSTPSRPASTPDPRTRDAVRPVLPHPGGRVGAISGRPGCGAVWHHPHTGCRGNWEVSHALRAARTRPVRGAGHPALRGDRDRGRHQRRPTRASPSAVSCHAAFELLVEVGLVNKSDDGPHWRAVDPAAVQAQVVAPLGQQGAELIAESAHWAQAFSTLSHAWRRSPSAVGRPVRRDPRRRHDPAPSSPRWSADAEEELLTAQPQDRRGRQAARREVRRARHRRCSSAASRCARSTSTPPAAAPTPASTSPR